MQAACQRWQYGTAPAPQAVVAIRLDRHGRMVHALDSTRQRMVALALQETLGRRDAAAEWLGISPRELYRLIRLYGITPVWTAPAEVCKKSPATDSDVIP